MDEISVKPHRGCLFYGCITGIVCMVAILLAGLLGVHQFRKMLARYTDTQPMPLPTVQMSKEQIAQVERRVEAFEDALRAGRGTPPLELSGDEVNALIANEPALKGFHGKIYVTLEGPRFIARLSLPMEQLGLTRFRGRYLNGIGTFSLSLQNGELYASLQDLMVKGKPVPSTYMDVIRRQNLARKLNESTSGSVALNRLKEVCVSGGKLILVPKDVQ